jgi:hypothetical protein
MISSALRKIGMRGNLLLSQAGTGSRTGGQLKRRNSPMTRLVSNLKNATMIAVLALLPFAAVHASAQKSARVNIPFAFQANHVNLPAGYYRVIASDSTLTFIDNDTGRVQAMLLIRDDDGSTAPERGRLEFYVSGSRHMLTNVQFAGSNKELVLLRQPPKERTVAQNASPADETIQIAMR